ncbi:hypothetical protein Bpfe_031082 [Biomphalaria pfeifferi]|uniref:Uncharacterized protein n=1 Tax=Biomphalaria pfeifferi TaxID=112525 RepID=A0AAD8ARD5_BIOPF|nr:hypothetical protein Bpfe_031082 [Biomphalaria pfeifferi]
MRASDIGGDRYLYDETTPEPDPLRWLRDSDLQNPAPFSHRTVLVMSSGASGDYERPTGWGDIREDAAVVMNTDVPVDRIAGLGMNTNMAAARDGMTFQELLFKALHGCGMTWETIDFLVGSDDKAQEPPQAKAKDDPKTRMKRGLELSRHGDWFIIENGQQRGIVAMYAIWHRMGPGGMLRNVPVYGA